MSVVLEARSVSVRAGGRSILDNVSLALRAGERVAVVGPNGAGKSTLLRVLSGELRPAAGGVTLKGRPLAAYPPRILAQHRAVLSQSVVVSFPFTVAEIVAMGAGGLAGRRIDDLVAQALAEVDMTPFSARIFTTLSGGEQQRAHLARVLIQLACGNETNGPGLLFLDEPTASLDLHHQLDTLAVTKRLAEQAVTVFAVLHDLNLATLFADRIVVLDGGRIVEDGPPSTTINDDMLRRVFRIAAHVGAAPTDMPFVLPHTMTPI